MDIPKASASAIAIPAPGFVTLFLNTDNENILSYKDENGFVFSYNDTPSGADIINRAVARALNELTCAVQNGNVKFTDLRGTQIEGDSTSTTTVSGGTSTTVTTTTIKVIPAP